MVAPRIHPPPPPSLPKEAPWREIEEVIDLLREVASKLAAVAPAIIPIGAPVLPGVPTELRPLTDRLDLLIGGLEWGQATGGGDDKLIHLGKAWADNIWAGCRVAIIFGTGAGQTRRIKSNDRTSLTTQSNWDINPDRTSVYVIRADITVLANKPAWTHGQQDVASAGTAEQLAEDVEVPDGCQLTILAKPGNTGTIYLGKSKAEAESTTNRFDGLSAGLAVSLKVSNANLVWVNAAEDGEGVSYFVEQVS